MACAPEESFQIKAWLDKGFNDHRFWELNKPLTLSMRGSADLQELYSCLKMFFSLKCECIIVLFANSTVYELKDMAKTLSHIKDVHETGNNWILRLVAKKDYSISTMKELTFAMEEERKLMEEESKKAMNEVEKTPMQRFKTYLEDYEDSDDSEGPDDSESKLPNDSLKSDDIETR